jgi:hypothetical protein
MHSRRGPGLSHYHHRVVVALAVIVSTFVACLAAFVGPIDDSRLMLFGLSAALAAVAALLASPADEKKISGDIRTECHVRKASHLLAVAA